jgi:hypothetical protein
MTKHPRRSGFAARRRAKPSGSMARWRRVVQRDAKHHRALSSRASGPCVAHGLTAPEAVARSRLCLRKLLGERLVGPRLVRAMHRRGLSLEMQRFAARVPGLAFGLALAVRPAGAAETVQGQQRAAGASRGARCEAVLRLEGPLRTMRGICQRTRFGDSSPGGRTPGAPEDGRAAPRRRVPRLPGLLTARSPRLYSLPLGGSRLPSNPRPGRQARRAGHPALMRDRGRRILGSVRENGRIGVG